MICGDDTAILDDVAASGAELYEADSKIDLLQAKRRIGDRLCLIGNLNPVGSLLHGTAEEVRKEAQACLAVASHGSGFILGTGCFVAWDTPQENLQAMIRAVDSRDGMLP